MTNDHPCPLRIQPYLLRKYDWGMMTRGISTFSNSVWIQIESIEVYFGLRTPYQRWENQLNHRR